MSKRRTDDEVTRLLKDVDRDLAGCHGFRYSDPVPLIMVLEHGVGVPKPWHPPYGRQKT